MKPAIVLFDFLDKIRYSKVIKTILTFKETIKKIDRKDYLQPLAI